MPPGDESDDKDDERVFAQQPVSPSVGPAGQEDPGRVGGVPCYPAVYCQAAVTSPSIHPA